MARNLAVRVAAARPARAGSGVANARVAAPRIGVGQARSTGIGLSAAHAVAGPAGPSASPTSPPSGSPWDSQAEREWGAGEQAYNDRVSGLEGDWQSRQEWYGLGETNNPYSQAGLLAHNHEVGQRGVMNGAGLQLYSGSTVNARASQDRSFDIGLESLKAAFAAEQARVDREEEGVTHQWESDQGAIREGALARAAEAEPPPAPLPPAAVAAAVAGAGASSGKGKKKIAVSKNRKA